MTDFELDDSNNPNPKEKYPSFTRSMVCITYFLLEKSMNFIYRVLIIELDNFKKVM
jgi:hypothetical protein